jgi:1-acyl-sn-glycerol-3-phosphate acyltransferase
MLGFLPPFLRGSIALVLLVLNTLFWCALLLLCSLVKLLLPFHAVRVRIDPVLNGIATRWIACNSGWMRLTQPTEWDVQGVSSLRYEGWYLVNCNHQSWADIFVLQHLLNRRIPMLKFFLKQQLIYVPVIGLAWWALDFPFMKRHSKEFLEKHPELKGSDLATTRKACERFRHVAVSVMNFVEGTRFTDSKHDRQASPYTHLLKPKAGGVAFVLNAMGDILKTVIDVTIVYPGGRPDFLDIQSGRLREVRVRVRQLSIPEDLLGGDYENDPEYRARVQAWITALWVEKDAMMSRVLARERSG